MVRNSTWKWNLFIDLVYSVDQSFDKSFGTFDINVEIFEILFLVERKVWHWCIHHKEFASKFIIYQLYKSDINCWNQILIHWYGLKTIISEQDDHWRVFASWLYSLIADSKLICCILSIGKYVYRLFAVNQKICLR